MSNMLILLLILSVTAVTVIGDYFIKLSGLNHSKYIDLKMFFLGLFFYFLTAFGWFYMMKYVKLVNLGFIYGAATAILLALVGYFLFNEQLNKYEIIGICLGLFSIFLLSRFSS